jgi:phosphatidylglycerophosphatase A
MQFAWWQYPVHALAYGFGIGFVPFAPGTFGSLLGAAVFWIMAPLRTPTYVVVVILLAVAGVFICGQTAQDLGVNDPGYIVFDEVVGFLVAMCTMKRDWRWVVSGFVAFRIFDLWKPFPIQLAEDELGHGLAIMADDILAGLYTLAVLLLARWILRRLAI